MSSELDIGFDKTELIIYLLNEIKDKIDLEQKSKAMLSEIAGLGTKLDYMMDVLGKPLNKQSDSSARHRERTW